MQHIYCTKIAKARIMKREDMQRLDILNFKYIDFDVHERTYGNRNTKKSTETMCDVEAKDKSYFYKFRVQGLTKVSFLTSTTEFKEHLLAARNRLEFTLIERIEISRIVEISKTLTAA